MYITWAIGITASLLTASGLIPQVIKGFIRKSVEDVSILWLFISGFGTILWFICGVLISDKIIVFANAMNTTCYVIIVVQKRIYK